MRRRLAAFIVLASLAAMLAAPAGASAQPPSWPGLPPAPFPHLRDGNNTTGNDTAPLFAAVKITSHRDREVVKERDITLRGTSTGSSGIRVVEVRLNGGDWVPAGGNNSWSLRLRLLEGKNTVTARATAFDNHTSDLTISIIHSAGIKDNTGILLAAAVIIPVVAVIVLFTTRRKPALAGETPEDHAALEKELGLEAKKRDDTGAELEDSEEVTRLEKGLAKKAARPGRR